jgi:hypothetical protein
MARFTILPTLMNFHPWADPIGGLSCANLPHNPFRIEKGTTSAQTRKTPHRNPLTTTQCRVPEVVKHTESLESLHAACHLAAELWIALTVKADSR